MIARHTTESVVQRAQAHGPGFCLVVNGIVSFEETELIGMHPFVGKRELGVGDCWGESTLFKSHDETSRSIVARCNTTLLVIATALMEPVQRSAVCARSHTASDRCVPAHGHGRGAAAAGGRRIQDGD